MKILFSTLLLCAQVVLSYTIAAQGLVTGRVTDQQSGETLPGATVYISELKTGTTTDINGMFRITNLPARKFLVQVKFLGYQTLSRTVDAGSLQEHDFSLQSSSIEAREVVITGTSTASESERNSTPVVAVDRKEISMHPSTNIIDALAHTPGVSQITTGGAVSKPVIRGLGFNRIVVLNDGVRQEGQQWGEEHGVEIDKFSAGRIEILRGPASLMYGSDAMGGVINIIDPLPAPLNTLRGALVTQYSSNEAMGAGSVMLEGNHNGVHGRVRGSYTSTGSYQTPVGTIGNTGYDQKDINSNIGINRKWGYSQLNLSGFESTIGFYDDEIIPLRGPSQLPTIQHTDHESETVIRDVSFPLQEIGHWRAGLSNNLYIGKSRLVVNGAYQLNERKEFVTSLETPELFMQLNTVTGEAKYFLPERKAWLNTIGIAAMSQQNNNKGEEQLIPDYTLHDIGGFIFSQKTVGRTSVNAGVRFDTRTIDAAPLDKGLMTLVALPDFKKTYATVSGSIGSTYRISKLMHIKANVGRGFRAPNLAELTSDGVHEGTQRYEIGNNFLKAETSLQGDGGIIAENKKLRAELNLFANKISNYIYTRHNGTEFIGTDEGLFPVYRYTQGDALLLGFEYAMDIHFYKSLHFENAVSFVHGENLKSNQPLPNIPPLQLHNELEYEIELSKVKWIDDIHFNVSVDNHFAQTRIDDNELPSKTYSLLNAGIGLSLNAGNQNIDVSINGTNLTDQLYFDHLNRLRYVGVPNKGRSFFLSAMIPFGIVKKKEVVIPN